MPCHQAMRTTLPPPSLSPPSTSLLPVLGPAACPPAHFFLEVGTSLVPLLEKLDVDKEYRAHDAGLSRGVSIRGELDTERRRVREHLRAHAAPKLDDLPHLVIFVGG